MHHDTPLISTIVAGLVLAFIFGSIANRFRMPPLVGYLMAGVLVGPYTPGFVADAELATELAEIGVILLMFGVGLHFSLKDLLSVRAIAVPGAVVQIVGATLMGLILGLSLGWSVEAGLLFGLALSVASTVVLLKALQDRRMIDSERGRIAVGWLIVEDMAMVLALVMIPAIAGLMEISPVEINDPFVNFVERLAGLELGVFGVLAVTVIKLAAFVGFMLVVGRRVIPFVLNFTAHSGSRELFRLAVLALALGVAAGAAYLFGVSLALGAFFAGMILSESELSHRAAQETLPLRDAFAVLFFVSVGMLFDPMILITNPLPVIATVLIIIVGKSLLSFMIVLAFRQPVGTALIISASLAQIGEFSFILAALGVGLNILPPEGRDLILAGAILSILLNPLIFWLAEHLRPGIEARVPQRGERVEPTIADSRVEAPPTEIGDIDVVAHPTTLTGHIVLMGYGRVGTVVADGLAAARRPFLVIEDAEDRINAAREKGLEVVIGNAASGDALALANVAGASTAIIAIPNAFEAGQAVEQCRALNSGLVIIARAHFDEEEAHLINLGANTVIMGEREIGLGMVDLATRDSAAVAEMTAADAVAAALGADLVLAPVPPRPLRPVAPDPVPDPEVLLDAIETAQVQHADSGPAEPPAMVAAFGEEPDEAPAAAVVVEPVPETPPEPAYKPRRPARTAATPFNLVPPPATDA
jgi:CPA2 family monovalent cation:H+ antiporter-2